MVVDLLPCFWALLEQPDLEQGNAGGIATSGFGSWMGVFVAREIMGDRLKKG